jgi:glycogen synthase kinase 3 beta
MTHPFFDDLKVPDTKMATGKDMPPLFNFTREGRSFPFAPSSPSSSFGSLTILLLPFSLASLRSRRTELSIRPDLIRQLVPPHCEAELLSRGIDINNFEPIPLADMRITLDVRTALSRFCRHEKQS